ncbi:methylenetetrahydrofolate--tRNA-(uracil-5-)-methyltransferase [Corynebacterium rhinophilum]|uniref:methylenetetrahydrofolate--tRNA-(uracil-5-)- methyltransferase n=1 Tax=Corynebacterium rhinophilum TaxID=3050197 RepID=UPI00254FD022|nr:methylenetetrahydrofolate--tRNA-(uracil-5-)-methyltransferase [Corynebacterium sp. MSK082]MDK8647966.1 methylenetetrahydrofolate--tRNA-(uracil-5-)-methyltransferase [Corynebacterium sp. MSK082]
MQRVAIIGEGPAALSTTERLLSAGMCVDLISEKTAPFGLLRRFAGLAGVLEEAVPHECAPGTTPRLRLLGNVRVGVDGDINHNEVHQLAAHGDRELIIMELKARGIPVTELLPISWTEKSVTD